MADQSSSLLRSFKDIGTRGYTDDDLDARVWNVHKVRKKKTGKMEMDYYNKVIRSSFCPFLHLGTLVKWDNPQPLCGKSHHGQVGIVNR